MSWVTEGEKTNPGAGVILADTGVLNDVQSHYYSFVVTATVSASVNIEVRNAANDATLFSQSVKVLASDTKYIPVPTVYDSLPNGRVRIVMDTLIVGKVQAAIFYS